MRVSVIVPLYNKREFIGRSLRSILQQQYSSFELIVVDDGSTDGSAEIVEQFKDPRVMLIRQENRGPGAARNTGLRHARGELVAFLDADDEWLPSYLSESIRLLDNSSLATAAVVSGYYEYPQGISRELFWRRRGLSDGEVRLNAHSPPMQVVYLLAYMSSWSVVARRLTLLQWGGFYSKNRCTYAEDSYLWLKVLLNERVRVNLTPLVRFHREASELSNFGPAPRPVEPFLLNPKELRCACPEALRNVLEQVLAIRALKTACVLGYWGKHKKAKRLLNRFATHLVRRNSYYLPALLLGTPMGSLFSKLWRNFRTGLQYARSMRHHHIPQYEGRTSSDPRTCS